MTEDLICPQHTFTIYKDRLFNNLQVINKKVNKIHLIEAVKLKFIEINNNNKSF